MRAQFQVTFDPTQLGRLKLLPHDSMDPDGRDSMFSVFRMVPQSADADCVISIEYYSEILNDVSKNWEVLVRRKYTDYN